MSYMPPCETLATTTSLPNSEALAACMVPAHPHTAFHPCTCGLCGGAAAVPATLIGYNDHGGCYWDDHEEETIVIDYFLYSDV
jgi:hypothetical protein